MEFDLDNHLYILRCSNLPYDLRRKFIEADKLFLSDHNDQTAIIINAIERECLLRGISLHQPYGII